MAQTMVMNDSYIRGEIFKYFKTPKIINATSHMGEDFKDFEKTNDFDFTLFKNHDDAQRYLLEICKMEVQNQDMEDYMKQIILNILGDNGLESDFFMEWCEHDARDGCHCFSTWTEHTDIIIDQDFDFRTQVKLNNKLYDYNDWEDWFVVGDFEMRLSM